VRSILDDAYVVALALMRRRQAAVTALVDALLTNKVLDGAVAERIVALHPETHEEATSGDTGYRRRRS